jgi:hypothetical protein
MLGLGVSQTQSNNRCGHACQWTEHTIVTKYRSLFLTTYESSDWHARTKNAVLLDDAIPRDGSPNVLRREKDLTGELAACNTGVSLQDYTS